MKMQSDHHPHTQHWLKTVFGLDSVPLWWKHRKRFTGDAADPFDDIQASHYGDDPEARYRALQRGLSRRYCMTYQRVSFFLGVMSVDPSDPYGVLRDFLNQGLPKLQRTNH